MKIVIDKVSMFVGKNERLIEVVQTPDKTIIVTGYFDDPKTSEKVAAKRLFKRILKAVENEH